MKRKQAAACLLKGGNYLRVEMDQMRVARQDHHGLRTHGVGPCIVLCGSGQTDKGKTLIGLYHWSGVETKDGENKNSVHEQSKATLNKFITDMLEKGCKSIELNLIGGQKRNENCTGTEAEQQALLEILADNEFRTQNHITQYEHSFNIAQGEDSLDVFMKNSINYYVRLESEDPFELDEEDSYNSLSDNSSDESSCDEDASDSDKKNIEFNEDIKFEHSSKRLKTI